MSKKATTFNLFSNFNGDLFGGLTAGIVALPLALAFGLSSGLGPDAGLYGAIFIAFFAALFGGTPTQISGPTAPMTALSMVIITGIVASFNGNLDQAIPAILTVFLLAGLMQVGMGLAGLGQFIKFIPYPVVSGFMTAIGLIILITQILPLLGYYPTEDLELINQNKAQAEEILLEKLLQEEAGEGILVLEDFKETIRRAENVTNDDILKESVALVKSNSSGVVGAVKSFGRAFGNINQVELILGLITIFIIFGFKRITTKVPSTLVSLIVVSVGAVILQSQGIIQYRPIPEIPSSFPVPNMRIFTEFNYSAISPYFLTALSLALLGSIDSLLTSLVADNMTRTLHDSKKELIGQGIGNSIAAIFGGIPGAGATIRTVVNINSGGKTKLSGMIAAILLLIILLALGPIASRIPAAVLAGILFTVGIGVMDIKGLKSIPIMPKAEVVVMFVVMIIATFYDLIYGVAIGLVISALIFMKKMSDIATSSSHISQLDQKTNLEKYWKDEKGIPEELSKKIFIKHLEGPIFFGYTNEFLKLANQIPVEAEYAIIRMDKVPYMDQSGMITMEDVIINLLNKDIQVMLVGLQAQPESKLKINLAISTILPEEHLFDTFSDCIKYISKTSRYNNG